MAKLTTAELKVVIKRTKRYVNKKFDPFLWCYDSPTSLDDRREFKRSIKRANKGDTKTA